ncbi:uncharacterized protein LOC128954537 [Oppia nitens]|uniref:uncharacterized protein LOC128954537 n=1 Tax=Oppia nitens TaxID=1686743 RepID=UPI0023DA2F38|nr:uncharacterized protein LOC128954537 [Oppia nitens]
MSETAIKRLRRDLIEINANRPTGVMVGPADDNNMFRWEGMIVGPEDSVYAGGVYKFTIDFPRTYPMKAPIFRFKTKIYHPNINPTNGSVCVDILNENWSSVQTVSNIVLSISSLLTDPNPDSPLNSESARLYIKNRNAYNNRVREWVKLYASPESL